MTELYGGKVASIEPGSIAEEAGIMAGDYIVSINGHPLTDIIDYRFYTAEEDIDILVKRGDEQAVISVEKDYDDVLGIEFEDELFDGIRSCGNRCIFCFITQLPRGMRRTLYVKDDDFRLSFLHGNFVTLTNVSDEEIDRIIEQRLTPLYVSVHTTDPELRAKMTGTAYAPDIMAQLRKLTDGGITVHTQIVSCPGVNDGEYLDQTVRDLSGLYPGVQSIGIVPVGLTAHRRSQADLHSIDAQEATLIIRKVKKWQKAFLQEYGTRLVWASDEFYLVSQHHIPAAEIYEGYPQYENGIGIVRRFMGNARRAAKKLPDSIPHPVCAIIVTSTLASPLLEDFATKLNEVGNLKVTVQPIRNEFFGEDVTVTGLLTGTDIANQVKPGEDVDFVVIPSIMLRDGVFLDDMSVEELSKRINKPVLVVGITPTSMAKTILEWSENQA